MGSDPEGIRSLFCPLSEQVVTKIVSGSAISDAWRLLTAPLNSCSVHWKPFPMAFSHDSAKNPELGITFAQSLSRLG